MEIDVLPAHNQWWHQVGAWRIFPHSEALPPTNPPVRKKNGQNQPFFRKIFGFLPPQNRILPLDAPHKKKKKKKSGATTAHN